MKPQASFDVNKIKLAKALGGGFPAGRGPTVSRSPVSTRTRRKL